MTRCFVLFADVHPLVGVRIIGLRSRQFSIRLQRQQRINFLLLSADYLFKAGHAVLKLPLVAFIVLAQFPLPEEHRFNDDILLLQQLALELVDGPVNHQPVVFQANVRFNRFLVPYLRRRVEQNVLIAVLLHALLLPDTVYNILDSRLLRSGAAWLL